MNNLLDINNINYIIYILIFFSIILTVLLIKKTDNKKKSHNKNLFLYSESRYNYIPNKKNKEIKDNNVEEWNKSDFNFSKTKLLMSQGKKIINPETGEIIIGFKDFFIGIQNKFNLLKKENVYEITSDNLKLIKQSIWSMDFIKIKNTIKQVNIDEGIGESESETLLKQIIILILKNKSYILYSNEFKKNNEQKTLQVKRVIEKIKGNIELNNHDLIIQEKIEREGEIYKEFKHIAGLGIDFLDFDINKKEISILVDIEDLFSRRIEKIIKFYLEKEIKTKIFI